MNEQSLHSDTQGGRVLSSISYFSIFFAPIILPIIIWIFADKAAFLRAQSALSRVLRYDVTCVTTCFELVLSECTHSNSMHLVSLNSGVLPFHMLMVQSQSDQ